MPRRSTSLWRFAALGLMQCLPAIGHAQNYPNRPIRLIVPYAPGGPTDTTGRIVAQKLSQRLGQNVVVDNRPGATAVVGTELTVRAPPDGYTILLCSTTTRARSPFLGKLPYDPQRDIAPISLVARIPYLFMVRPDSGMTTVKDLIAAAKAKPGTLNYGSSGTGAGAHLSVVQFALMAGIEVVHVPYKGSAPAAADLMGGHLQFVSEGANAAVALVRGGRLAAIGIASAKRQAVLPDVPTIAESGVPGYSYDAGHGICTSSATPPAIVALLGREIGAIPHLPDVRDRLVNMATEPVGSTPDEFAAIMDKESPRLEALYKMAAPAPR
jgi:tripartite-type tricarboxylate transporter receptor subunit TctC